MTYCLALCVIGEYDFRLFQNRRVRFSFPGRDLQQRVCLSHDIRFTKFSVVVWSRRSHRCVLHLEDSAATPIGLDIYVLETGTGRAESAFDLATIATRCFPAFATGDAGAVGSLSRGPVLFLGSSIGSTDCPGDRQLCEHERDGCGPFAPGGRAATGSTDHQWHAAS